ncbi:MAG: PDZ domain-containing protein [Akkermansiaceae bacterium]
MKTLTVFLSLVLPVLAQFRVPQIPPADEKITSEQAEDFFRSIRAVTGNASKVVFPIYSFRKPIASAISVGDEMFLAKLSEVAGIPRLAILSRQDGVFPVKILGAYPEHDLAVIYVKGLIAPAADWSDGSGLLVGSILAAVRSDGEAQGIGVKSVAARSLRNEDQGFLGVSLDVRNAKAGVMVRNVPRDTAAAEAGIRRGDRILSINDREVNGFFELSTLLKRLRVGEQPKIVIKRQDQTFTVTPRLRGNPQENRESERELAMETYSGGRSGVYDGFPNVIQSDMELAVNSTGLPVVDLNGKMIGMVIARAGRISTLILPSELILELLKEKPKTNPKDPARKMVKAQLEKLQERYKR